MKYLLKCIILSHSFVLNNVRNHVWITHQKEMTFQLLWINQMCITLSCQLSKVLFWHQLLYLVKGTCRAEPTIYFNYGSRWHSATVLVQWQTNWLSIGHFHGEGGGNCRGGGVVRRRSRQNMTRIPSGDTITVQINKNQFIFTYFPPLYLGSNTVNIAQIHNSLQQGYAWLIDAWLERLHFLSCSGISPFAW